MNKKDTVIDENAKNTMIASSQYELTQRFGEAGSQFLMGLRGVDNETGQRFDRSLLKISQGKINPEYAEQNIKQQAGFSAEVSAVSKRNAEHIINKSSVRVSRSEDIPSYGKNHPVIDLVESVNGEEVTSQMKFVSNKEALLRKIACGEGGGKTDMSRYLQADKLEVPTEQVESMKEICKEKAEKLIEESNKAKAAGKIDIANKKAQQAENYQKLKEKISDSGLTTEEAINTRNNPRWETTKNIAKTGHQAGIEGAKFGAAIGGSISIVNNIISVYSGDKAMSEALIDSGKDTLVAGTVGYATATTGTVIKACMSQSAKESTRNIAKTGLPAMVVSACLATGKNIKEYAKGNIDEAELIQEVGLTASGMLSASMFTVVGQIAIPIPVLGGLIGGMVGYTLTNTFYQSFFEVLKEEKLSAQRRKDIEMRCEAAILVAREYELQISHLFATRIQELEKYSDAMFKALDNPDISPDEFCLEMNRFAETLGKSLSIKNMAELETAMLSNDNLII